MAAALLVPRLHAQEPRPEGTRSQIHDAIYGYKQGVATTMDVFKPAHPNGIGVLWLCSGGWVSDHNFINPELAAPFNRKGQTVFEVVHGSRPNQSRQARTSMVLAFADASAPGFAAKDVYRCSSLATRS